MWKWIKRTVVGVAALAALGFVLLGTEAYSYVKTSGRMVQEKFEENIPFEIQIQRARQMLDELVPEMHANIKQVAREQVEIAALERELAGERESVGEERAKVAKMRSLVDEDRTSYRIGFATYTRDQLVDELGRRFKHFQTAEVLVASKEKLLENRRRALAAALDKLEKTRVARVELEAQIEGLETQFRLVQAEASTSDFALDDSKLAQINRVLGDLRKRLEVSEKVLAHESRFIENIPIDAVDETSLLEEIDSHFAETPAAEAVDSSL